VIFVFALALMSKSMVVTLPFVLLLLDYWPLGRTRWAPPAVDGTAVTVPAGQLVKEKLPLFALAAASSVVTFLGQPKGGQMDLQGVTRGTRIANAVLSYAGYIGKMFWPTRLAIWYPLHPGLSAAAVTVAGIGLVAMTIAVIRGARHRPWLVTGWFWYLGMLVPVIGLVQGNGEAMADRFTYLPSIGLTLMLSWSVPAQSMERRGLKMIMCVVAVGVLAICAVLSRVQIGYWKDSETLFRHALDVTRDNWLVQNNLGFTLGKMGRFQEAAGHYEEALRIKPDYAQAQNNLGNALMRLGRTTEAVDHLEQALRLDPDYALAHCNLAVALQQTGRLQDAISHYEQALRLEPNYAEAHCDLGIALMQTSRTTEAMAHLEQALRAKPNLAVAHYNLGVALEQTGKVQEAVEHYEEALRNKPDYTEARDALARLHVRG
jgi:Flp pilus assembly protein TadD